MVLSPQTLQSQLATGVKDMGLAGDGDFNGISPGNVPIAL